MKLITKTLTQIGYGVLYHFDKTRLIKNSYDVEASKIAPQQNLNFQNTEKYQIPLIIVDTYIRHKNIEEFI